MENFILLLNEIILPILGYGIIGFIALYFTIHASHAIKSEADNTAILIVKLKDADDEVGDQVKNVFTTVFNEFIERRKNDNI